MMDSSIVDIEKILISRKVPVLDEAKIREWSDFADLDYPVLVATAFEYATTDDPNAFYITARGLDSCCGLEMYDLILIEPNKSITSGDIVFLLLPQGFSLRKFVSKEDIVLFVDEKQEPVIFSKEKREGLRYYRVSQCIKKL